LRLAAGLARRPQLVGREATRLGSELGRIAAGRSAITPERGTGPRVDLAPGRSLVEFLVGQEHQVFVVSWRNPDARHRDWGLDTYGGAIVAALDAVQAISEAVRASVFALCSGGIAAAMVAAHLSVAGRLGELASLCLGVAVLDQEQAGGSGGVVPPGQQSAGTAGAVIDEATAYVIAGAADHLCPWQSCYRTTQLIGGQVTFALSTSGHIAAMVNPPGNPKAAFQTAPDHSPHPADPREFLATAQKVAGSWWPHYSSWLAGRSGGQQKSPSQLGRKGYPVRGAAPGNYVHDH